jgi:hypothetical protein
VQLLLLSAQLESDSTERLKLLPLDTIAIVAADPLIDTFTFCVTSSTLTAAVRSPEMTVAAKPLIFTVPPNAPI